MTRAAHTTAPDSSATPREAPALSTPRGMRLFIGLFGRRNAGKSSLLNALTGQSLAIVSPRAGTTTDPVEKAMELLPLGPVVLIDTAGVDDEGELGALRVDRTRRVYHHNFYGRGQYNRSLPSLVPMQYRHNPLPVRPACLRTLC